MVASGGVLGSSVTDALNRATAYTYDATGAVLTVTDPLNQVTTNVYDVAGYLASTTYSNAATHSAVRTYNAAGRVTKENTTLCAYDAAGELTKNGAITQGYDAASQLTTAVNGSTSAASYTYNGDGLRASKKVGSTTAKFVYHTAECLPLVLGDGAYYYLYGPGGVPFEQVTTAGVVMYLHADQLGSIRMLTDSTGKSVGAATYTAYGTRTTTGTTSAFGYAGQYTDTDTGLQWLRARYYDPATGQFLTVDPLTAATGTRYAYAGGNPITGADPSGMDTVGECVFGNAQAGVIGLSADGCLTRVLGTKQIGIAVTAGLSLGAGVDGTLGGSYEVSNASSLADLSGGFCFATIGAQDDAGVSITVFWNTKLFTDPAHATYGAGFGISAGEGINTGIGASDTSVKSLTGLQRTIALGIWDAMNPLLGMRDLLDFVLTQIHALAG